MSEQTIKHIQIDKNWRSYFTADHTIVVEKAGGIGRKEFKTLETDPKKMSVDLISKAKAYIVQKNVELQKYVYQEQMMFNILVQACRDQSYAFRDILTKEPKQKLNQYQNTAETLIKVMQRDLGGEDIEEQIQEIADYVSDVWRCVKNAIFTGKHNELLEAVKQFDVQATDNTTSDTKAKAG